MKFNKTAVILVGYQNDYFSEDGILRAVIEESDRTCRVKDNTLDLMASLQGTGALLVETPIIFTPDYSELVDPVGILKAIVDVQAFRQGESGSDPIAEFEPYRDRIVTVEGKRGLNAFSNTHLDDVLQQNGVEHVILAGAVTSICIDSTGRAAHERGYRVSILSDCTASRTPLEQQFYCENVFPLYADVLSSDQLLHGLSVAA